MTENPFDQLGLKKEVVSYLQKQGKLYSFLKGFYRLTQMNIHPDQGGNNDISALVNSAYQQIQQHSSQVDGWIASMQNGVNPEYLELIEGLAGEVERLQKIEKEHEELKVKYVEILTGNRGEKTRVKTAHSSRRTKTDSGRTRTPPRVEYEEPSVRTPPKSSSRKTAFGRKSSSKKEKRIITDPIELSDIILYDVKGKPAKKYKKVILAGEAEKDKAGNYLRKTQDNWIKYFREKGKEMLDFPLFYACVERMQETDHPGKTGLLKELKESWHCLATRFDYSRNKVIHGYGFSPEEFSCTFPIGNDYLDNVKDKKKYSSALQALLMPRDLDRAIEVLHNFTGVKLYIWTPDKNGRKNYPKRAAFVDTGSDRFVLSCGNLPGDDDGLSRWVVKEE
ncbi:hypothetical protein ACFL0E_01045 [Nanoarchaeota archaeon]